MSTTIPDDFNDLLARPIFVNVATVMPDGQPQLTVMWCSYDGQHILLNTTRGRQKEKNMSARPMVTILAIDPENPFRYLEVRGKVEEISEEGALEHANSLAQAYVGKPTYYGGVAPAEMEGTEARVLCKIKPTRVVTFNMG